MASSSASATASAPSPSATRENDEIKLYVRGRFLCSMDAVWRTLGYHTYPATEPGVITVKCKLPEQVKLLQTDGKCCDMLVYLQRPGELHHLKMNEFFKFYDWGMYVYVQLMHTY
jgi:hypothetical protein